MEAIYSERMTSFLKNHPAVNCKSQKKGLPKNGSPVCMRNYLPAAALVPAMRPVVKHIWMEVPEAGYSL